MNGQKRCKSCGEPLAHKAKRCPACGASAPSGGLFGSLGDLAGGALDMVKAEVGDEHRRGYGYTPSGAGLQTITFQSKQDCERWRYQMGPNVQIVNVTKNKQHDMFGGKHKTYTVSYQTYGQQPAPQAPQPVPPSAPQEQAPQPAPEPAAGPSDVTEQIKKLAELHDQGILTDEEFQTKKKELLAKM